MTNSLWVKTSKQTWSLGDYYVYAVPQTSGNLHWYVEGPDKPAFHFMLRKDAQRWVEERLKRK